MVGRGYVNEIVQVIEQKFDHFPAKFEWNGEIFQVDTVERCWTEMHNAGNGAYYIFEVRCGSDRYRLSQDIFADAWSIQSGS